MSAPKPYDNPCPTCGAKPGSPCRILGSNRKAELHAARLVGGAARARAALAAALNREEA